MNHEIPAGLEAVIGKALEKDRNLRYQHASEMRTELQRLKRDTRNVSKSASRLPAWPKCLTASKYAKYVSGHLAKGIFMQRQEALDKI